MTVTEIQEFSRYATERAQSAGQQSLEECLRAWRDERELQASLADIRAGVADLDAGRSRDFDEIDRDLSQRLGVGTSA